MLVALHALLVLEATTLAGQPTGFVDCGSGILVQRGQACPPSGPHPAYVFFDAGQAALTERTRLSLDMIAINMRRASRAGGRDRTFLVEGYADRSGSSNHNLDSSRRRAEAVRTYLVGRGIAPNAIGITYFGEERPAVDTADGAVEPNNRRAVIWTVSAEFP